MWVSVEPAKGNSEILPAVSEVSCDSTLLECKSFAFGAIIPGVFVVNLHAYGPAFEDTATNPVTLSEKEREGRGRRTAGQRDQDKGQESTRL